MSAPNTRWYTPSHEWIARRADNWRLGLTAHAVENLGEIVFIEIPPPATRLKVGDRLCVVESVKAASEIYSPLDCTITAANEPLHTNLTLINTDPEDTGWILEVSLIGALPPQLLDHQKYTRMIS